MRLGDLAHGAALGAAIVVGIALGSRWLEFTGEFALGVTTGVLSSAAVVLILGIARAPQLILEVGDHADGDYPHGQFRFVHVRISNPGRRIWRWQLRRPATYCRAELSFGDLGAPAHRFLIDGPWSSLPEPVQQLPGSAVLDFGTIFGRPREVINAGDQPLLCVAVKQAGTAACFAFNNRSYLFQPNWSNPEWGLGDGTYWVRVRVAAAEVEATRVFYLVNTGATREGLSLQETVP